MKIDLPKSNVLHLDFSTEVELENQSLVELLGEYGQALLKERPILYGDAYFRHKKRHVLRAVIFPSDEEEKSHHIHWDYDLTGRTSSPPKQVRSVLEMMKNLSLLEGKYKFRTNAIFTYPIEEYSSILQLPMKLTSLAQFPYDEIRGIRVAKYTSEGELRYQLTVDVQDEDLIFLANYFYEGRIIPTLGTTILKLGTSISERFLVVRVLK